MGHVPAGPIPQAGHSDDLPRRQHRRGRAPRARAARQLGRFGEDIAVAFLARRGSRICARNVRVGRDEIDLIVERCGVRVAVEVKTRAASDPVEEFTPEQARLLWRAAAMLQPRVGRCDVVLIRVDRSGVGIRWLRGV